MSSTIHTELTGKETLSDFEKLLNLAEELKSRCDSIKQQISIFWFYQIASAVFLAGVSLAILLDVLAKDPLTMSLIWRLTVTVGFTILVCIVILCAVKARQLRQLLEPERKALTEVIGLLREVESVESKSPLERAYFRIRLSRFDIGY